MAECFPVLQNGLVVTDDINGRSMPGIEKFEHLVDVSKVWPLTFVEQWFMAELTAALSISCYAGTLKLQALGLGGWFLPPGNRHNISRSRYEDQRATQTPQMLE